MSCLRIIIFIGSIFMFACSKNEDVKQEDNWYIQIFNGVLPVNKSLVLSSRINEQGNLSAKTFPFARASKVDEYESVYIIFGSLNNCAVCLDPSIHEGLYELVKQESFSHFELKQYQVGNTLITVLMDESHFVQILEDILALESGSWKTMVGGFRTIDQLVKQKQ